MSEQGVPVEKIAHLVGHSSTSTTETVYCKELRPVISTGAEVMDLVFKVSWATFPLAVSVSGKARADRPVG